MGFPNSLCQNKGSSLEFHKRDLIHDSVNFRSSLALARSCVKRLPCSSSVFIVENGKVMRCERDYLSGMSVSDKA